MPKKHARFLECCVTSLEEALEAQAGGAQRVELCEQLSVGGVTPSIELIRSVRERLTIPVNVLVRPRGGNFVFSEEEVEAMLKSIEECREAGINAVVIGALDERGNVDMPVMRRLIEAARPLKVTFHRAFDVCANPLKAFEDVISLGCERLLTSGHEATAYDGRRLIGTLVRNAAGRIIVMAGCGVKPYNIVEIERVSEAPEYHSSAHGPAGTTDREVVSKLADNIL